MPTSLEGKPHWRERGAYCRHSAIQVYLMNVIQTANLFFGLNTLPISNKETSSNQIWIKSATHTVGTALARPQMQAALNP